MVNLVIQQGQPGHLTKSTWSFNQVYLSINKVNMVIYPGQSGHLKWSTW